MDLRPQNVFFDPKRGEIIIIDIGTCIDLRTAAGSRPTLDVHDCLAELCKFYLGLRARRRTPRATATRMAWGRRWDLPGAGSHDPSLCRYGQRAAPGSRCGDAATPQETGVYGLPRSVTTCSSISSWLMSVTATCKIFRPGRGLASGDGALEGTILAEVSLRSGCRPRPICVTGPLRPKTTNDHANTQ